MSDKNSIEEQKKYYQSKYQEMQSKVKNQKASSANTNKDQQ